MPIAFNQRVKPLSQSASGFGASMRLAYDFTEFDSRLLWDAYDYVGSTNPALVPTGSSVSVTNNGVPGRRASAAFGASYSNAGDFGLQVGTGDYTLAVLFSTPSSLPTVTGASMPIRIDNNGTTPLHEVNVNQYTGGWGVGANANVGTSQSLSFIPTNARVAFFIRRLAGVTRAYRYIVGVDAAPVIKHSDLPNTTDWNAANAQRVSVLAYGNTGNYADQVAVNSIRFHNVALSDVEMKLYADDWWAVDNSASDATAPVLTGALTVGNKTNSTINLTIPTATDNIGVSGYQYRVNGGSWQANGASTDVALSGLLPLTSYTIDARAFDGAGNYSNVLSVTTSTYRSGALGSVIRANTGPINGNPAGILYNDVNSPADDNKWFSFRLVTSPATGVLSINPNGTFSFTGPSAEFFTYQLEVDGVDVGSPVTVTLYGSGGSTPSISIGNVAVAEGVGVANLTVALSAASSSAITVNYATTDGTAVAGSDYVAANGTLTFNPGETSKQLAVIVIDDTASEGSETIIVNLSSPTNATLSVAQGTITINANDAPPIPSISVGNVAVAEGVGVASVTVALSASSASIVTVDFTTANGTAVSGSDYGPASGTLTFSPGETSKLITVTILDDATQEANETILINLTNPTGATLANSQGIITINASDTPVPMGGRVFVKEAGVYVPAAVFSKVSGAYSPATVASKTNNAYS